MTKEAVYKLNSLTTTVKSTMNTVCKFITLNDIISVKTQSNSFEDYFNIQFTINENEKVTFEALVLISDKKIKQRASDEFGSGPYYNTDKQYIKVMYVKRLDAYAGLCEEISLLKRTDPMFCICKDFDEIKKKENQLISDLYKRRKVIVASGSCEKACNSLNMACDEFAKPLFSHCSNFPNEFCDGCKDSSLDYEYVENQTCFLNQTINFSCSNEDKENAICYCKKLEV